MVKKFINVIGRVLSAQFMAALTGLMLTHWMSVGEYAVYTVYATTLAAVVSITKGGASLGASAIMGRFWPNKEKAVTAMLESSAVRIKLSIVYMPPLLIFLWWMLWRLQVSILGIAALIFMLAISWALEVLVKSKEQVVIFEGQAKSLQLTEVKASVVRFLLVVVLYFTNGMFAGAVVLANFIGSAFRCREIQNKYSYIVKGIKNIRSEVMYKEIWVVGKRQLPVDIFQAGQLQFILIIISMFGNINNIAEFGALGRLAQLLAPASILIGYYVIPRFAKSKTKVKLKALQWMGLVAAIGVVLIACTFLMPDIFLMILGDNYSGLHLELRAYVIGLVFSVVGSTGVQLLGAKGYNKYAYMQIIGALIWIVFSVFYFNLNKFIDVLWMLAFIPVGQLTAFLIELKFVKDEK